VAAGLAEQLAGESGGVIGGGVSNGFGSCRGDQLGAVREGGFHLHLADQLRDPSISLVAGAARWCPHSSAQPRICHSRAPSSTWKLSQATASGLVGGAGPQQAGAPPAGQPFDDQGACLFFLGSEDAWVETTATLWQVWPGVRGRFSQETFRRCWLQRPNWATKEDGGEFALHINGGLSGSQVGELQLRRHSGEDRSHPTACDSASQATVTRGSDKGKVESCGSRRAAPSDPVWPGQRGTRSKGSL